MGLKNSQKMRHLACIGGVMASLSLATPATSENLYGEEVVLQGLDKITARVSTFTVKVGQAHRYGSMHIELFACERTPPEEPPESIAFLKIKDVIDADDPIDYFSGWMYASSPALHSLEHPVHDIWVKECIPSEKPKPKVVVVQSPDSTAKPEKKEKSFLEKLFLSDEDNDEQSVDNERSDSQLKNLESTTPNSSPNPSPSTPPSASTVIKPPENTDNTPSETPTNTQ